MEWQQKRKTDLEKSLLDAVHILNGCEQQLLYATDYQERLKIEKQIDLLKKQISDFQVERDFIENQIKNHIDLPSEKNHENNKAKLLEIIGKAHLLQVSRSFFTELQKALDNTSIIVRSKQDIEAQVRGEVEENIRDDLEEKITALFKDELRQKIERGLRKSKKNKRQDQIVDQAEIKVEEELDKAKVQQKIRDEIDEKLEIELCKSKTVEKIRLGTERRFQVDLNFNKKIGILARELRLPIDKTQAFFEGGPVESHIFKYICSYLNLNDYEVIDTIFLETLVLLVPEIRHLRCGRIKAQCGTLRILDFSRPIGLGDLYVDVNILNEPVSYRYLEISDLPKIYNPETDEVDRFGLGEVRQPRVPGVDVIRSFSKLMILGKPGAGKSTFLQHLAIQCNQAALLSDRIPIFIRLKTFSENARDLTDYTLLNFITEELSHN